MEAFGGEQLYIPMNRAGEREALKAQVLELQAQGLTIPEIARRVRVRRRVSVRWLRRLKAEMKGDARKRG